MVPDPKDPTCCKTPQCDQGNNPNPNPTPTSVPGVYTGSHVTPTTPKTSPNPNPNPNATPTPFPPTPAPAPACVYKGNRYTTGQTWQDGCSYDCVCLDDMTGNYQCTDKCPNYPNLPLNCRLVYDPLNPCCKKPECPPPASPATPGPNGVTPTTVPTPPPAVCVYNGVAYRQGQTWNVGCDKVCVCEDASTKRINCDDRCPSFQSIPAGCQLTTDPQDSCCQMLNCPVPPVGQPITPLPPAYVTGQSVPPQGPTPFTGRATDVCVYQGKTYNQGEKWQDGCTYTCVCMDAVAGRYMCTDRCPVYPNVPASCTMVQDPNDSCCKKPFCPPTSAPPTTLNPPSPTQPGSPTQPPTPMPLPPNVCVYMGQSYKQGQQWYDGCSKICRCDDASRNFYRCEDRCAVYSQVPQGCNMVPDPADPVCCEKPECPVPLGPQPTQGFVGTLGPQPTPGSVTGVGKIPTPRPTPSVSPGSPTMSTVNPPLPRTGCYYDNKVYKQGDRWQSGCKYTCVCSDGVTGRYSCDELCPPIPNNLPPECRAIQDPQQPCCGKVYCDTVNPTPQFPTPGVKPSQNPYVYTPVTQPPSGGQSGYCVFQGVYYKQGQSWNDGCSKRCTCEDTMTGYYTCRERCPSFDSLPPVCKLITDPSDSCCLVPVCNTFPTPLPTGPNGVTLVSPGPNTNLVFTPAPAPPGSYVITGNGASGMCVYNGRAYTRGQQWDVGCEYRCECIDAVRGQYRCTDRCPQYYDQLPQNCAMTPSKTDSCCKEVTCDLRPNKNNTPIPSVVTVPPDMCVYTNNRTYAQGSTWTDGCSGTCQCVDSVSNNYICSQRCPVYNNLPSTCTLIPDPSDACCKKPSCTGTLTPLISSGRPTISPTLDPTVTNVFPLGTHTTITGSQKPSPGVPGYITGMRSGCVYQNTLHKQGETWNDGCDYVCACVDASRGFYRCTSKCPQLPPLPSYCAKRPIPGQCCPTVTCNLPNTGEYSPIPELTPDLLPTPAPPSQPGQPTGEPVFVVGTGDKCVAKDGREFNPGQSWTQGCDYNCTCLDGRSGYYECVPICPTYSKLPSNCRLEKAGCCNVPKCTDENGNTVDPLKNPDVYPVVSTISGGFTGFRPGYLSNINSYVGSSDPGCVYKGVVYKQGAKWDDGCDYSCECEDALARRYKCVSKCPRYTSIPASCQKVADPQGGCCDIVTCPSSTPKPPSSSSTCQDKFNNCTLYGSAGSAGCVGQYEPWARAHCAATCGYCPAACQDKIADCKNYGQQGCVGQFKPWAEINCPAFCGFCTAPTPANPFCKDKLDNCANIAAFYCTGIYEDWARTNCNATCQLCDDNLFTVYPDTGGFGGQGTLGPTSNGVGANLTGVSDPGWQLLLKGVGGAPGDLIATWKGPGTVNANNPIARQLDNQLKENYKPSLPNYWDKCKFELVKLSVMTNGQENGYIIFNATGTDRLSWFDPSRIVNSSFSDLKGAQFDSFSLDGDANSGHRFVVTQNTQSCDMRGWLVMTTKSNCFYERGTNQPAYLYASNGQAGQFGIGQSLTSYHTSCSASSQPLWQLCLCRYAISSSQ
ncbi:collagen alpha-4(VI) chain [Elysia marginata]|uniref:Collagen alpha-4(VI) chain n=1 Tax=Elysia marginata TaxID=1093978 RepID=A0AAV4FA51_9GAST|nr:collagen alpha-4(VI) chain [Elysia marginata]